MIDLTPSPINGYGCASDPGEPGTNAPRLSINDTEGRILSELVRGRCVLEIGTGLGVSTRWLASTASKVFTVDIDEWVQANVWPGLPANVFPLTSLENINICAQAAFIDGLHTYEQCSKDIQSARLIVKPGGLLVFHDLYISGVYQAIVDSGLPWLHIETRAGMAVAWV